MNAGSVCAIVLNWNGARQTVRCLEALRLQTVATLSVLVVDNGSTDGSPNQLQALQDDRVRLHRLADNRGFAGGMNAGLEIAFAEGFEYVWLVNNDAYPAPECLALLLARMRADMSIAMLTPRVIGMDGVEQQAGGLVDFQSGRVSTLLSAEMPASGTEGLWLTGTAPLVRSSALRAAGLFDEQYFAYWEDIDLSIRLSRNGAGLVVEGAATVEHEGGASSGGIRTPFFEYLFARNRWLFLDRNTPRRGRLARWNRFVADCLRAAGRHELRGVPQARIAVLAAISAARAGRFGRPEGFEDVHLRDRILSTRPWGCARALDLLAQGLERFGPAH